ncbi:MAG: hypothetical protein ACWA44_08690 [Thiotrichales bacterium]
MRLNVPTAAFFGAVMLSLTACSGGGGSDPAPTDTASADTGVGGPTLDISGAEGKAAAPLTYLALSQLSTLYNPDLFAAALIIDYAVNVPSDSVVIDGGTVVRTGDCVGGGSAELTSTLGSDGVQAGDAINVTYNNCGSSTPGFVQDGSAEVSFDSGSVSDGNYDATVRLGQYNRNVTSGLDSASFTLDGDLQVQVFSNTDAVYFDHYANGLTETVNVKTGNIVTNSASFQFNDFEATAAVFATTMEYDANFQLELTDETTGESGTINVLIAPESAFVFEELTFLTVTFGPDDNYPSSGLMTLTGANQTTVSLDAATGDPDTVNLTVDGQPETLNWVTSP